MIIIVVVVYECLKFEAHWGRRQWQPTPVLAWKIPWTEEPGRLQSMESLRVGQDWMTSFSLFTFMHWGRKWQPTPVFLPGESQGRGSPRGLPSMGSHRVGHDWSDLAAAAAAGYSIGQGWLLILATQQPQPSVRSCGVCNRGLLWLLSSVVENCWFRVKVEPRQSPAQLQEDEGCEGLAQIWVQKASNNRLFKSLCLPFTHLCTLVWLPPIPCYSPNTAITNSEMTFLGDIYQHSLDLSLALIGYYLSTVPWTIFFHRLLG